MKRSLTALVLASLALAGCGSATDGLAFKPPAGWTALPSALGFGHMAMWFKKGADNKHDEMVMLIRGQDTTSMNLKTLPQAGIGTLKAQKSSTITICGSTRAQYLTAVGTGRSGDDQTMEMVSTPVGNQSYLAMYIRPHADKADPDAEAAIRSLCPEKT